MDQFSNEFASHWDELVGWDKRSVTDSSFLLKLIQKYDCRSVLDAALGTGFDSIELLKAGIKVKSVDVSQAMIDVAIKNAKSHNVELDVLCMDWIDLSRFISKKFDCVICLGNSLACEMDSDKRQAAIQNWSELLTDNGIIIVDRRNYEALIAGTYSSQRKGNYFGDTVKINFNKVTKEETIFSYTFADSQTFDLKMFPILDVEIREMFLNANLNPIEVFGDRILDHADDGVGFYLYVFRRINYA